MAASQLTAKPIRASRLIGWPLSSGRRRGSQDAIILAMFASGVQGAWYDPSDFSTLFQDAAGTIPVTATGQPVGKILDKSGFENHLTQATEANRPLLQQDDLGYYYLDYDGVNDILSASVDFSATDKMTVAASFKTAVATDYTVLSFGAMLSEAGSFDLGTFSGGAILYRTGTTPFGARAGATMGASTFTLSATIDFAGDTHAEENPALRVNGAQYALTDYGSADTGASNFGNHTLGLGGGYGIFDGRIYGAMVFDRVLDVNQLEIVERFLNRKSGLFAPAFYSDSAEFNPDTTFHYGSTFSHVDVMTSATDFLVGITSHVFDYYPQYASIGVYVDGVFNQEIDATVSTMLEYPITLPAGMKTVSFVNGLQSSERGSFVSSVRANAPMTQIGGPASNCLLFYADSIGAGSDADPITQNPYALIVRYFIRLFLDSTPPLAVEAWGGRSLYEDCVDAPARAAFVAKVAAYDPVTFYMTIGTNDYGMNLWTAANFGTAYAALLDDLHTAMPDLQIYCQTPILRLDETANGLGSTLEDYRDAIAAAVVGRTAFAEFVDGKPFVSLDDIPDGVHPNTAGHFSYASNILITVFS